MFGFVLLRRLNLSQVKEGIHSNGSSIPLLSMIIGVMGVLNLLSGMAPAMNNRLHSIRIISPFFFNPGEAITNVISGIALLVLSQHLWRCKRVAWLITISLLVITTLNELSVAANYMQILLSLGLIVWLFLVRARFVVQSDGPMLWQGLKSLGVVFSITVT
jgi:phosphatidylglycerol lysyltransferase